MAFLCCLYFAGIQPGVLDVTHVVSEAGFFDDIY